MDKQRIDSFFADKLRHADVKPSADVWQRLQERQGRTRQKVVPLWWYASAAACLLLIGIGTGLLLKKNTGEPVGVAKTAQKVPAHLPRTKRVGPVRSEQEVPIVAANSTAPKPATHRPERGAALASSRPRAPKETGSMSEELVTPVTGTPEPQLTVVPAPATPQPDVVPQQKGRTLLVVIAEPEALTTARRMAQTPADAEERMAVRDVTPIKKILRQVKLIKEGDGLALKGDEERGLLSRAYQEVKQNLKQDKPEKR